MKPIIPKPVSDILLRLNENGYEAYIVGGCVRDFLLNKLPHDWDITTNATPDDVKAVFSGYHIEDTGIKHGTVSIIINHLPFEVTTYRIDGDYSDSRHPDKVSFSSSLKEDLARRDFTMNAIAYHPEHGLKDYFGGEDDIRKQIIRCVGNPLERFEEDALRILRALRFSSVLGFSLSPETRQAISIKQNKLEKVASERKTCELFQILSGDHVRSILIDYHQILNTFLPYLSEMAVMEQDNPYHIYNLLEHTAASVEAIQNDPVLRLTMLLHDTGKLLCKTTDESGTDHFYGHAKYSIQIAEEIFEHYLCIDNSTASGVLTLIRFHDTPLINTRASVLTWLNRLGEDMLRKLILVKQADIKAQSPLSYDNIPDLQKFIDILDEVLSEDACFSRKQLNICGDDLIRMGIPQGKQIGYILNNLLNMVINGELKNEYLLLEKAVTEQFL